MGTRKLRLAIFLLNSGGSNKNTHFYTHGVPRALGPLGGRAGSQIEKTDPAGAKYWTTQTQKMNWGVVKKIRRRPKVLARGSKKLEQGPEFKFNKN